MTATIALASQAYAQQIAKQTGAENKEQTPLQNNYVGQRKPDLQNIFKASNEEAKAESKTTKSVEPIVVVESVNIFADPVANSQFKAAQKAKQADLQNYDSAAVGARFGGIA